MRRFAKAEREYESNPDKPDLSDVLTHYGVQHSSRVSQTIRCPVHGDYSTPSCSINLDKGLWKCQSCGEGGDSWTLLMKLEGIEDFRTARTFAADLGLCSEGAEGSDIEVRQSSRFGGNRVASSTRTERGKRPYRPSWSRK